MARILIYEHPSGIRTCRADFVVCLIRRFQEILLEERTFHVGGNVASLENSTVNVYLMR